MRGERRRRRVDAARECGARAGQRAHARGQSGSQARTSDSSCARKQRGCGETGVKILAAWRGVSGEARARRSPGRRAARTRRCAGSGGRGSARARAGYGGGRRRGSRQRGVARGEARARRGAAPRARRSPKRRAARARPGSTQAVAGVGACAHRVGVGRRPAAPAAAARGAERGHAAAREEEGNARSTENRQRLGLARAREAARTYTKVAVGSGRRVERLLRVSVLRVRAHCARRNLRHRNENGKVMARARTHSAHTRVGCAKAQSAEAGGDVPTRFLLRA